VVAFWIVTLYSVLSYQNTTWSYNPENLDFNLHRREDLKSPIMAFSFSKLCAALPKPRTGTTYDDDDDDDDGMRTTTATTISSVNIETRLWAGRPRFSSWQGNEGISSLLHRVQTGFGAHPAPIHRVPEAFAL
jgi:hypothetical protein